LSIEGSVRIFIEQEKRKFNAIEEISTGESTKLFKKVLYSTTIDALSRTVTSPKVGNRERFISIVSNFCDWKDKDRISLIHLIRVLEKVRSPEFSNLREYAYSKIESWGQGGFKPLDLDPEYSEIIKQKLWPTTVPKPLESLSLESLKHINLLYVYRNSLVHEMREPGCTMETHDEGNPYYQGRVVNNKYNWELLYPVGFYKNLVEKALNNLSPYYIKDRINPLELVQENTFWLEELQS
jgi:hypothetical protein